MTPPGFFRVRLEAMIDLLHPLAVLVSRMPWVEIESALAPCFDRQDPRQVGQLDAHVGLLFACFAQCFLSINKVHLCLELVSAFLDKGFGLGVVVHSQFQD